MVKCDKCSRQVKNLVDQVTALYFEDEWWCQYCSKIKFIDGVPTIVDKSISGRLICDDGDSGKLVMF